MEENWERGGGFYLFVNSFFKYVEKLYGKVFIIAVVYGMNLYLVEEVRIYFIGKGLNLEISFYFLFNYWDIII